MGGLVSRIFSHIDIFTVWAPMARWHDYEMTAADDA